MGQSGLASGPGAAAITIGGARLELCAEGALYWPDERTLIVADLHLEKASALAPRHLLPPYDSAATLAALGALCRRLAPRRIIALGDSFHDESGHDRLPETSRRALAALQAGREWLWVAGNHDPAPPVGAGGDAVGEIRFDGLAFRHRPMAGESGEIAGHLHPAARVRVRGRAFRRKCFIGDGTRMILPAFGALTGSLNVLDPAFAGLFPGSYTAWMLGRSHLHAMPARRLLPDG